MISVESITQACMDHIILILIIEFSSILFTISGYGEELDVIKQIFLFISVMLGIILLITLFIFLAPYFKIS